ncbi:MAG: RNA polymerase sigma factor [Bacilli bacterium]
MHCIDERIKEMELLLDKDIYNKELMESISNKSKEALTILYENTSSQVYGFALSIVKNHHLAEEIMQETYIKIYNSASSYKEEGKLMSWILTIVKNLSFMQLRENKYKINTTDDYINNIQDSHNGFKEKENKMLLEIVLNILSDEERQIVILYAITGLKHKEISEFLNIPLSTILSKYNRALKKLKKHMEVIIHD